MAGGYMRKTLRVDLTSGSIRDEKLPEASILKKLIGGQALASYILDQPRSGRIHGMESARGKILLKK